ncbi:hypothetical protein DENSPDRAFT_156688 [Dentipellis sp. KUC8613]|nr:hypothetical protein DENSPDRAFT_156688 [Dentipellis sp. KUC8613]
MSKSDCRCQMFRVSVYGLRTNEEKIRKCKFLGSCAMTQMARDETRSRDVRARTVTEQDREDVPLLFRHPSSLYWAAYVLRHVVVLYDPSRRAQDASRPLSMTATDCNASCESFLYPKAPLGEEHRVEANIGCFSMKLDGPGLSLSAVSMLYSGRTLLLALEQNWNQPGLER